MKTTKRILMLLVIASISTIIGCAKDGKDGLPGPQGPAGQNGNANVKTYTFYVPLNAFSLSPSNNSYEAPTLSYAPSGMSIGQYDDVSLYVYQTDGWYALPYIRYFN